MITRNRENTESFVGRTKLDNIKENGGKKKISPMGGHQEIKKIQEEG